MLKSFDLMLKHLAKRCVHTSAVNFKGHSKWQNIKHIKAANDQMKSLMTIQQLRLLRIASIEGGSSNPEINSALRGAIEEAQRRDVPRATIRNFLKKLSEAKEKTVVQRHTFEGKLYKKLLVIITFFPESLGHTKNQIGSIYRKHLVEQANAKRVFNECGTINVTVRDGINVDNIEDECLNDAIMCGAEDIEVHNAAERQVSFLCHPQSFSSVRHKLETMGHKIERSECIFYPNSELVQLNESELVDYQKFKNKLMKLEGFDEIYDNLDDDDENP